MRKGKVTIIASILTMLLIAGAVGAGTLAYFSDTETSAGNSFTAGTLDLTMTTATPGQPWTFSNMKPGDVISGSTTVKNTGTLTGELYGRCTYVDTDLTDATDLADMLIVTSWQDPEMLTAFNPGITLKQMANQPTDALVIGFGTWMEYGTLAPSASGTFAMEVTFNTGAGNEYQGDGVVVTFEYLLVQLNHPKITAGP